MTPSSFKEKFGIEAEASASAPGRVNLLGEHTDYNDGFVLPIAIPQRTHVQLARSHDATTRIFSAQMTREVAYSMDMPAIPRGYAGYIIGCIRLLQEKDFPVSPVCLYIDSNVPIGAGLSSSAALEVAVLRGLRSLFNLKIDDVQIALMAQQAEIRYAHVHCGIMDQMASSLADTEHMLFLDARSLERKLLPLPEYAELLVVDSGVPRSLADSSYNERRTECEEAARLLGVASLRDVDDLGAVSRLPEVLRCRARHVISENQRVLEAVRSVKAERFGELMNASHASLRDDFEVSIDALDQMVGLLQADAAVYGARLTGAGFGGACVAMVRKGAAAQVAETVLERYKQRGYQGKLLVAGSM
ncbi:galactokinase [Pelotalea chapellei]|uniref:Galactokinase n=1 Tax=Pelotalea chapellei TaxID=44671 RepID=A0ABS5UCQ6_9BACT|nr:galactokinase [Pelotalea chapellei]MBT1073433.1 galactokinase [Pelotalea chapellei]